MGVYVMMKGLRDGTRRNGRRVDERDARRQRACRLMCNERLPCLQSNIKRKEEGD